MPCHDMTRHDMPCHGHDITEENGVAVLTSHKMVLDEITWVQKKKSYTMSSTRRRRFDVGLMIEKGSSMNVPQPQRNVG